MFVGDPDDLVIDPLSPGLPTVRDWTRAHFAFAGYVTGTPRVDREAVRDERGWAPDEQVCVVAADGSGVGGPLLRRVVEAHPYAAKRVPSLRTVVVTGPRLDPQAVSAPRGVEVHGSVSDLYRSARAVPPGARGRRPPLRGAARRPPVIGALVPGGCISTPGRRSSWYAPVPPHRDDADRPPEVPVSTTYSETLPGTPPRMDRHEIARLKAAAMHARRAVPGPLGELAARELLAHAELGYRGAADALLPQLARQVLAMAVVTPP